MKAQRKFVTSLVLLALLFGDACTKKKPVLPPQTPAPTLAEALPDEIPEKPEEPTPEVVQAQPVPPPVKSKPKKPARTATSNNKKTVAPPDSTAAPPTPATAAASPPTQAPGAKAPPTPATAASASPPTQAPGANTQIVATARTPRTAAPESPPDLAIAAAIPSAEVSKQKEETVRMVDATENTLKGINRSLSDDEKAMRTQIQSYLQQSRQATADGDVERAFNLAKKAQLLADALTKK
jgi:hypothetical protein